MNLFGVLSEVYPTLLTGLTMTVKITILSLIIALVIGIFVCLMNISSNIVITWNRKVLYLADSWYSDAGAGIFISILQSFARLNNNINLTRYHEKENDHCIFKYKYIAAIFFMFNYTRNYNRR